jgi:hypothetical protein
MDDSVAEVAPRNKRTMTAEHKEKLRRNAAKAREVRAKRVAEKRKVREVGDIGKRLPGEGAVDILRRMLIILSSRFSDQRMDKRSCLMCEMRVPVNPSPQFVNTCPCQEGWRYIDQYDRMVQENPDSGEGHQSD